MDISYPHEIVHVPAGQKPPKGYVPITAKECEILDGRSPEERAAWIKERRAAMDARFARASRRGKR